VLTGLRDIFTPAGQAVSAQQKTVTERCFRSKVLDTTGEFVDILVVVENRNR